MEKGEILFSYNKLGYDFDAEYIGAGDARITIRKGNEILRDFKFPAYKVWNIPAHDDDIINGLEQDSDSGLLVAGSDLLGGNAYQG